MSYAINRRPLLKNMSDSEFEDEIETEVEDPRVSVPEDDVFIKILIPQDRYNLAYIVFYLLGVNTLVPWSFFITADDYWMYKFRDVHPNNSGHNNYTHSEILSERNNLQASFTSYVTVASALPGTFFLIINAFLTKRISLSVRMIGSQFIILVLFILTTVFVKINTDDWQSLFLIITLTIVAVVNAVGAIFSGSLMGIIGRFAPKYITAMSAGQALAGIFTAIAEIMSIWIGASPVTSGLLYFIIGDITLLLSLTAYIVLERAIFFKHHLSDKPKKILGQNFSINEQPSSYQDYKISYMHILRKIWPYGISMFLVFFVSVLVYPSVTVLTESENKGNGHPWNDIYFEPVVTYLIFSLGDYIGRIVCGIFLWPKDKPWLIVLFSIGRIIFVPAFLFCNAQPRHHLPVYIHSDLIYILLSILFSFTNGYICNMSFILTPNAVEVHEKETASVLIGAFLGVGFCLGSGISMLMVKAL